MTYWLGDVLYFLYLFEERLKKCRRAGANKYRK